MGVTRRGSLRVGNAAPTKASRQAIRAPLVFNHTVRTRAVWMLQAWNQDGTRRPEIDGRSIHIMANQLLATIVKQSRVRDILLTECE